MKFTTLLFEQSEGHSDEKTDHNHFLHLALIMTYNELGHTELEVELGVAFIKKYCLQDITHLEKFRPRWMDGWIHRWKNGWITGVMTCVIYSFIGYSLICTLLWPN